MSDERFPVEIFFGDDDEYERAQEVLADIDSEEVIAYDGVVEGTADISAVEYLANCGLHVDFPEGIPSAEAELASDTDSASLFPSAMPTDTGDIEALRAFRARAAYADVEEEPSGLSFGTPGARVPAAMNMLRSPRKEVKHLLDGIDTEGLAREPRDLPDESEMLDHDVYRMRLSGKMRPQWREALAKEDIDVCQQEQPDLCDVFLTKEQVASARGLPFVRAIKRYGLTDTVTPQMLKVLRDQMVDKPTAPAARRTFDVVLHRSKDLDQVISLIESVAGKSVMDAAHSLIRVELETESPLLAALANLPFVRTISPYEAPSFMCRFAREVVGITNINDNPAGDPGPWDGQGECVAVIDSGIDDQHPDLAGCVKTSFGAGRADDAFGHGSHVAGIVAGTGVASGGELKGVAPAAKIVSVGIRTPEGKLDLPADWGKLLGKAKNEGAKIINLSLGKQFKGEYQAEAESMDAFCRENPDILVVVAAGNEGEAREGRHKLNTVGMPGSAKNVVTVGASASSRPGGETWGQEKQSHFPKPPANAELVCGDPSLVAAISSRGPTDSRQVKPDIVAPGTRILSVRAEGARVPYHPDFAGFGGRYGFLSGTSMATPVVSGAAAILRQYLRDQLQTPDPSAALLKAILIASTDRLPATPGAIDPEAIGHPDFEQGFGLINLANVIPAAGGAGRKLYFADVGTDSPNALAARQPVGGARKSKRRYKFKRSTDSQGPVRIVLTWTDAPGRFVQNELQLSVNIPGGEKILGNHQHKAFVPPWAAAAGMENFDTLNNVERVTIEDPAEGTYRITIFAQDTPRPPQGYALCVSGDMSASLAVTL